MTVTVIASSPESRAWKRGTLPSVVSSLVSERILYNSL